MPVEPWKNSSFMLTPDARPLRILAEYLEPQAKLRRNQVFNTIVFWGSARALSPQEAKVFLQRAKKANDRSQIERAQRLVRLSRYYDDARELSRLFTLWSKSLGPKPDFLVATGGSKGIMEAANRGASDVSGRSVGLAISLAREEEVNKFVTRELSFEFRYFFMRKFWMVYLAKALIVFPGGFGTLNELSEIIVLCQTGKPRKRMPIVLYGSEYWSNVLNIDALVEWGTISPDDKKLFKVCDSPREAYEYVISELSKLYALPKRK